ncbi:hypothetical protein H4R18_002934 [Coemansia javaensis]|uniref:Yeast cell wall synthesis Kre9/Knh1-like N-terminal domain-containing protein n=1 Tax=Coemansia javaensis TaxID=2761396 RepID=A0A9W8HG80_9FUNG|nr:hypothetical protein H4R18_002934 [Coemansia javaensis]
MKVTCAWSLSVLAGIAAARLQITLPNSHTEWHAGSTELIRWKAVDGALSGHVSIELMEGNDPANLRSVATIVEDIPSSSQQAYWSVPKSLKSSKNYAIKIVDETGDDYYGQFFKGSSSGGKDTAGKNAAPERAEPPRQRSAGEPKSAEHKSADSTRSAEPGPRGGGAQAKGAPAEPRSPGSQSTRHDASAAGSSAGAAGPGLAVAAAAICMVASL